MRAIRACAVLFAAACAMQAQNGTVQNAALYQGSEGVLLNAFSAIGTSGNLNAFFAAEVFGISPNIISPRMLAVLSYEPTVSIVVGPQPIETQPQPVNATLFLRPSGSSTLIPVTVTNAVAGAIAFVVPAGVPVGGAELLYQINDEPTQWTTVNVVQSSFAFFTNGPGGTVSARTSSSTNVGLTTPVQPGQTLVLTGSGLGYGTNVTATIGGVAATVLYAGASGTQSAGHDEIWLQVPANLTDGCYVPVIVNYNQNTTATTVSGTSNGMPCRHPWGLSVSDMKNLDGGGYLAFGEIDLSTDLSVVTTNAGSRNESAEMNVSEVNAGGLAGYFPPPPKANGCSVVQPAGGVLYASFLVGAIVYSPGPTPPTPPDPGTSVTLQSPTTTMTLTMADYGGEEYYPQTPLPSVDGPLSNLPTPAIAGGKWMWQSPGSSDLAASSFNFTLPPPIQLTGGVPVSINRTQDQTISWNGAAFDAGATVNISLDTTSPVVTCNVPAATGTVTIPASMLSNISPNTIGTLMIGLNESGAFLPHAELQLTNGSTLLMIVSFSSSDARPIFFQ